MREIQKWRQKFASMLRGQWPSDARLSSSEMCNVELLLTLQQQLIPDAPAAAGWTLLMGYSFPIFQSYSWTAAEYVMLGVARHLLPYYRSPFPWQRALRNYRILPEHLRGYDIDDNEIITRRDVTIGANRFEHYLETLSLPPAYKTTPLKWAQAGAHRYLRGKQMADVTIPEGLVSGISVPSHPLTTRQRNSPIHLTWADLLATAKWMDDEMSRVANGAKGSWEHNLSRVRLELIDKSTNTLHRAEQLTLDGMINLVGMVSSGKTTLITVMAVWLARHQFRVALIVGDVINALNRSELFAQLGISVAPVLGSFNREHHLNRLHRMHYSRNSTISLLQEHKGFDWLSTACALSGLSEQGGPLNLNNRPCIDLHPVSLDETDETTERRACPLFDRCDFHRAQRDLVDAQIWIATPASMVYTRVATQINQEQLRFAELIYRRSHVVLVDEADQVQVQLDNHFSPNQTLAGRSKDAWLTQLSQQVVPRLNQEGRAQLAQQEVEAWCSVHDLVQMATNRVYGLILQEPRLQREVTHDYFTEWMLLDRLAVHLSGAPSENRHEHEGYRSIMDTFNLFLNDPIGERQESELATLAQRSITHPDKEQSRQRITEWIRRLTNSELKQGQRWEDLALLCEFALVLAVLSDRLNHLLRDWKQAEAALQLDGSSSIIFQQPPEDYSAVIPVAPIGNVLAFQYVKSLADQPGDLRFFRCMGVGRWLLLHLHELFAGEGLTGPHVVLFSGTSWAGSSPSYHIQLPVDGILRAPDAEVRAISQDSRFSFDPVYDENSEPIRVSGLAGEQRRDAIHQIVSHYATRRGIYKDKPSQFEAEKASLPPNRQRILLLVGSYEEVEYVVRALIALRPEWDGQILGLASDDDEALGEQQRERQLPRGLVQEFARTGAWILVAPLLAVERGHNIMNKDAQAAIGAAYFLIRPHPRPDDISYAIQSINRWAIDSIPDITTRDSSHIDKHVVISTATRFREAAFKRWRYLLKLPMIYSTLPVREREAVTWSQLVTIWQVIGRLVRGGSPAHIYFCDAAFAPQIAASQGDNGDPDRGLLTNILSLLRPYFDDSCQLISQYDKVLVQTLYGPFYSALKQMKGFPHEL